MILRVAALILFILAAVPRNPYTSTCLAAGLACWVGSTLFNV